MTNGKGKKVRWHITMDSRWGSSWEDETYNKGQAEETFRRYIDFVLSRMRNSFSEIDFYRYTFTMPKGFGDDRRYLQIDRYHMDRYMDRLADIKLWPTP